MQQRWFESIRQGMSVTLSDAIRDVTSDCAHLNLGKDDIKRTIWDVKPEYIRNRGGM